MTATALRYVEEYEPGDPLIRPQYDDETERRLTNWGRYVAGGLPFHGNMYSIGRPFDGDVDDAEFTEWLVCRSRWLSDHANVMFCCLKIHYVDRPRVLSDAARDLSYMAGVGKSERNYCRWLKRARLMMATWYFLWPMVPEGYFRVRRKTAPSNGGGARH